MWGTLGLLLALVSVGVLMAVQALGAHRDLRAAAAAVPVLREQLTAGDIEAAQATASRIGEDASGARDALHGPHWWLAARLPGLGEDVAAVRTVTEVVDDLASDAIPDLVGAAAVIDPASFAPRKGRIDLACAQIFLDPAR